MRLIRKILAFPFLVLFFITFCLSDILEWTSRIAEVIAYTIEGIDYSNIEIDNSSNDNFKYGG